MILKHIFSRQLKHIIKYNISIFYAILKEKKNGAILANQKVIVFIVHGKLILIIYFYYIYNNNLFLLHF